jgi:hypothetical protein
MGEIRENRSAVNPFGGNLSKNLLDPNPAELTTEDKESTEGK